MAQTYYSQHLRGWDWRGMRRAMESAIELWRAGQRSPEGLAEAEVDGWLAFAWEEDDQLIAQVYLGRVYLDSPSRSYYAPWSPIPERLRDADERWWDALYRAAEKHGLVITSGDGDPTDTYAQLITEP